MQYFHYEQHAFMNGCKENKKLDDVLQKYFPENDKWGACVLFNQGKVETIEINKLSDVTQKGSTWTHYASIGVYQSNDSNDGQYWEVYSQFNGEKEDELWIFGYYKKFGDAVRRVKLGIEKLKPIKIY